MFDMVKQRGVSRGSGERPWALAKRGASTMIEDGVRVLRSEFVEIGANVYIGHDSMLVGYPGKRLRIGSRSWIGPKTMIFGHENIDIEQDVGIGPRVTISTSQHAIHGPGKDKAIIYRPIHGSRIRIKQGADIGCGAIIMGGVSIGRCAQIGAGAVVTKDVGDYEIWAGVPARKIGEVAHDSPD